MKIKLISSPSGEDILLKTSGSPLEKAAIVTTPQGLHQLDWAIRNFLENQPFRVAKEATGHANKK